MNKETILKKTFYLDSDIILLSKLLLGKVIETNIDNKKTSAIIVETEAYAGIHDKASHSYQNKKTIRNQNMFKEGGIAYIYLCYGMHSLFNVVTNLKNHPQAILIRAVEPIKGIHHMEKRRNQKISYNLTSGPGKLTQALGIQLKDNGSLLNGPLILIKDIGININQIKSSPRIGVSYAKDDALKPWRFRIKDNKWCS